MLRSTVAQQYIVQSQDSKPGEALAPLGSRAELVRKLGTMNTAPDHDGGDVLYGPGVTLELPPNDPVTQMILNITEEEIAWHVIMRLTRICGWKMLDPTTGREFNAM